MVGVEGNGSALGRKDKGCGDFAHTRGVGVWALQVGTLESTGHLPWIILVPCPSNHEELLHKNLMTSLPPPFPPPPFPDEEGVSAGPGCCMRACPPCV